MLLLLLFIFLPATLQANDAQQLCHSMEINTLQDLYKLQQCHIVVGHVEIFNFNFPLNTGTNYSSALVEITDYLVVHRIQGLQSLQQLLPQLVLIRGAELLFDRYSLVVYENQDLLELSLISLLRIQRGSVRIESNPILCFVETINWIYLLRNSTQQHFTLRSNKSPNHCPVCETAANEVVQNSSQTTSVEYDARHCWNLQSYQRKIAGRHSDCRVKCNPPVCDSTSANCCSVNCLSGCLGVNCDLCASYADGKTCIDSCNVPLYQLNKRECVGENICRKRGLIPHNFQCLTQCPNNYQLVNNTNGVAICNPICSGTFTINAVEDVLKLADCTTIRGSLIVELMNIKTQIVAEMESALLGLKEITGYLKVIRSPQLLSLSFLQNLDTIRGDELIDNKYSLYVVDNHHLEQIWAKNQKVAIIKGRVYFHLNPQLCYQNITWLAQSKALKSVTEISIQDASPNSNGERASCGDKVFKLNATVEDVGATEVRIKIDPLNSDVINFIFGYSYHYKESPKRNVTMYDGRHGCGHDKWLMDISPNQNVRHVISNLKPFTQYAFFVKTMSYNDYHYQIGGYSDIKYFFTSPTKPDPVAKIFTLPQSLTEMVVHWWPPRITKGHIKKYLLHYEAVETPKSTDKYVSLNESTIIVENCQCNLRDPNLSGPLPSDVNYYNKITTTYDEAISNFIYVPVSKPKAKPVTNNTTSTSINDTNTDVLDKIKADIEKKIHDMQDNGFVDFPIKKPLPICEVINPSDEYQKKNNCTILEQHEAGVIELPGDQHSYTLKNLQPKITYRITIRACVDGLHNGCGPEKWIAAVTANKDLLEFLEENPGWQDGEVKH